MACGVTAHRRWRRRGGVSQQRCRRRRRRAAAAALAAAAAAAGVAAAAANGRINAYQWRRRIVIAAAISWQAYRSGVAYRRQRSAGGVAGAGGTGGVASKAARWRLAIAAGWRRNGDSISGG